MQGFLFRNCLLQLHVGTIQLVSTGQRILCTQQMLERVSAPFWEDALVPTSKVEDTANCNQLTIFQPISHFPASPTSQLLKKQRKQERKKNDTPHSPTTIWRLQTSKHEILACPALAATKTNTPLSLLLF